MIRATGALKRLALAQLARTSPAPAATTRARRQTVRPRLDPPTSPLLRLIQHLADAHGWHGESSIHAVDGIRVDLWRGTDLLKVQLLEEGQAVTAAQREWQESLQATGKVEVYVWAHHDETMIRERLSQPERR